MTWVTSHYLPIERCEVAMSSPVEKRGFADFLTINFLHLPLPMGLPVMWPWHLLYRAGGLPI